MNLITDNTGWLVDTGAALMPLKDLCRRARLEAGLTIGGLETLGGFSHPTVGRYEMGKATPQSVHTMLTALMALGYSVELKEPGARNG